MIDKRIEIYPTVETGVVEKGIVEIEIEIKIQEIKGKIYRYQVFHKLVL